MQLLSPDVIRTGRKNEKRNEIKKQELWWYFKDQIRAEKFIFTKELHCNPQYLNQLHNLHMNK